MYATQGHCRNMGVSCIAFWLHNLDVIVATETWLSGQIFARYTKFISPWDQDWRGVLIKKNLCQITKTIFNDPEGRQVVLDVSSSSGKSFRLVVIYAPSDSLISFET